AGKPFLQWQIEWLMGLGTTKIHLALGYMANAVQAWLDRTNFLRTDFSCSIEPQPLGTAGALKWAEPHICSEPFCVVNGDTLLPQLNLDALLEFQNMKKPKGTIAVTRLKKCDRFGLVEFDMEHLVTGFREKGQHSEGWVNAGFYCLSRKILDQIEPGRQVSLEQEIFPRLVRERQLYAFIVSPPLLDMGTSEGLWDMTQFFATQTNKFKKPGGAKAQT
ncbi:MAG: sugar phosphate nucleotidyltransferase, partial [Kiritimatiellia bacterium]